MNIQNAFSYSAASGGPFPVTTMTQSGANLIDLAAGDTTTKVAAPTAAGVVAGLLDLGATGLSPVTSFEYVVDYSCGETLNLYTSNDGTTWTSVFTLTGNTGLVSVTQTIAATTARFWQFLISLGGGSGYIPAIDDFRLYAQTGGLITPVVAPTAPAAPLVSGVTSTSAQVAVPALAGGATSYNLQRAQDNAGTPGAYATVAPGVTPSAMYPDIGLLAATGYYYRLVGVNGAGSTNGTPTTIVVTPTPRIVLRRATIFQGLQLAAEPIAGQITPATVRLLSLQCDPDPNIPLKTDRLMGTKAFTATQQGKEYTTSKISGYLDFNAILYLLASQIGVPGAPIALAGGAYQWNFRLDEINPASPQTYTAEVGNGSAASRFGYAVVDGFTIKHAKEDASVDGTMFGQAVGDNITMTQNVPDLPAVAAPFKLARVSMGLTPNAFTKLQGSISGEIRLNAHWKPAFFQDDANPSFTGVVETVPDYGMQIVSEMNSDADALLSDLRNDQIVYVQKQWTGPLIALGTPNIYHLLQVTMPVKVTKQARGNHDDVYGATFDLVAAHDSAFGTVQATVINKRASL